MIRLLCVDDDPLIRTYLATRLGLEPDICVTGVVSNARDALEAIRLGNLDVVILDYQMDGQTGMDLLKQLMQQPVCDGGARPRILFCTGWADDSLEECARSHGAAGVVAKEQMSTELVPAVRAVAAGGEWYRSGLL